MAVSGALAVLAALQVSLTAGPPPPDGVSAAPAQLAGIPWTVRVAPQRADLLRYNRVEGASLGVRGQLRPNTPVGPLSMTATARFGTADRVLSGRLGIARESLSRRVVLSGYHELAAIEGRARHLGPVNSLMALLAGRDDGDYYRRSGVTLEVIPSLALPRSFRVRASAEYHRSVGKKTDVQLPGLWNPDASFRPNLAASEGWEVGGSVELSPRFGSDPTRAQAGLDVYGQAAGGAAEFARARLGADLGLPLAARLRLVLAAAGGTSWGSPSTQRLWYVGGPLSLRGYGPRAASGQSFGSGRVEIERQYAFGSVGAFSDIAWAGARDGFDVDDALYSAGASLAVIDGIVRVDGAWQLRSPHHFRVDVYLDRLP